MGLAVTEGGALMSEGHDPEEAIGQVTHYFGHLSVAAVTLSEPLAIGERIHIRGHTTDLVQEVTSMEIEHAGVDKAAPGDDVAIKVDDHVREHDLIFREG
jgi:putative protease